MDLPFQIFSSPSESIQISICLQKLSLPVPPSMCLSIGLQFLLIVSRFISPTKL